MSQDDVASYVDDLLQDCAAADAAPPQAAVMAAGNAPSAAASTPALTPPRPVMEVVAKPAPQAAPLPVPALPDPPAVRPNMDSSRWLRMGVGRDCYAFELLRVQEVVRLAPVLAMRGADEAVLGVMNLRGRIVPVFDLGRWLNGAHVETDDQARIVVVERDDELIGVLVTRVEDVVTLTRAQVEPPLPNGHPGATVGVARTSATPTVLLDANALFG